MLSEWPLISYTLLGQAAAGLFLAVAILRELLDRSDLKAQAHDLTRRPAYLTGVLLAGAVILSMMHLGSPMGAFRAVNNIGSSWLSREILMTGVFGMLWLAGLKFDHRALRWATALAGVGMVYTMAMLYQNSFIPAWMTLFTLVSFMAAMLTAGGVLILATAHRFAARSLPVGSVMALVGIGAQAVALPVYLVALGSGSAPARKAVALMAGSPWLASHLLLTLLTAVLIGVVWHRKALSPRAAYTGLLLGLAGQAALRVIFYAAGFPIGVG